jgi:hypothetical protein
MLLWGTRRILANPAYGLYAFVFVISVQPQHTYGWSPVIAQLRLPFLMGFLTLIGYFRLREKGGIRAVTNPHNMLMIAFLAIIIASALYNQINPMRSKMVNEFVRSMTLYFLLINLIDTEEKFVTIIWVWVGTYAYMAFLGISNHSSGRFVNCKPFMWYNKNLWGMEISEMMPLAAGLVWNVYEPLIRNRIAMKWLALVPLSLFRVFWWHKPFLSPAILGIAGNLFWSTDEKRLAWCWRVVAGLAALAAIVNGMWCHSRSAYLATVICVGLITLYEMRRLPRTVLIGIVLAGCVSYVGMKRISNTYYNIVQAPKTDGSAFERINNLRIAAQFWSESPVLGIGPDQFVARSWGNRAAHNGWAQVTAELGSCGLIVFASMFLMSLGRCFRNLMMARRIPELRAVGEMSVYLGIAYIAWAFGTAFQGFIYYHHVYMIAGLTVAAEMIIRRHLQQETVRERQRTMSLPRVAPAPLLRSPGMTLTQ